MTKNYRTVRLKVPRLEAAEAVSSYRIEAPEQAVELVEAFMARENSPRDREIFGFIAINARGRPVGIEVSSVGTLTAALVHPREVFRSLIALGAASVIFWHTHPSGDPGPSDPDRELLIRLETAGSLLGIPVLDSIVIGANDGGHFSMGATGQREVASE